LKNYKLAQHYFAEVISGKDAVSIIYFNDTHSHAEVLSAFDKAIELSKKE
jgi:hypothetical protein